METTRIDGVLRDATESGDIPGVVAMAATADEIIYAGAFGRRWLPDGPAMTLDTVFWIASMTKAITSTAAMLLVEQGKLELDSPIGKVVLELESPQVLEGFSADGQPQLRPARRPVTLRQLLTHTSGFGYDIWNPALAHYREVAGLPQLFTCQNAALNLPLVFDPGERWEYGISIDWIGKAIERVSGRNLQTYFDEHLFRPLKMKDTGFKMSQEIRTRLAGVHARLDNGRLERAPFEMPQEPEFQMGGGGLYGTAGDYLSFERMFLRGGDSILRPQAIRIIAQNHIGDVQVTRLPAALPFSNQAEFFPGMAKKWGLAFMINTEAVPGGRSANSLSWAGLFNTYNWIDLNRGVAGVMLTQIMPFFDEKAQGLFDQFEKAIYANLR
jgi:methyl acetate hydrolase